MPAIDSDGGHVRLRLDIAYDGTEFAGWATQAGQRTVAGVIDEALSTVFRTPVVTRAAGRTDTGVHATGQVAHVDVPADADTAGLSTNPPRRRRRIPAAGAQAGQDADRGRPRARHRPRAKRIRRPILCTAAALRVPVSTAPYGVQPQLARFVDAVAASARRRRRWPMHREDLLGLHDFAAFCRHREGATTIRDLQRLDWSRDGDLVTAHVTADAFCWSMVRSLVGALLAVGEGRREPGWCAELLTATRRSSDFAAAPARGLCWSPSTIRPTTNSRRASG